MDVDPATVKEIRVTFSKPMMDKSWSWTQGNVYSFPETTGPIHYLADKRTCVMPVKLEPGKTYVIGINGGRFNNFKDAAGNPSLAYTIGFRTRSGEVETRQSGSERRAVRRVVTGSHGGSLTSGHRRLALALPKNQLDARVFRARDRADEPRVGSHRWLNRFDPPSRS